MANTPSGTYTIGSEKGYNLANSLTSAGQSARGSDGSTWTRQENGDLWVEHQGQLLNGVVTYKPQTAAPASPGVGAGAGAGAGAAPTGNYYIGSEKGYNLAQGLQVGQSGNATDGSVWTRMPDGSLQVVDKDGRTLNGVVTYQPSPLTQQFQVQRSSVSTPTIDPVQHIDITPIKQYLEQSTAAAKKQADLRVDNAVQQGVNELARAQEDAEKQFQTQQNQISADEAVALDNQALYAEARGDKGGIGAAQYASIQNTAATNRMTVNSARTKLATDTARQIADLRAQGEFQKADSLLTVTQNYLSQLMQLEQWGLSTNLSVDEFNANLQQWEAEFELEIGQILGSYQGAPTLAAQQFEYTVNENNRQQLASMGQAMLAAGIQPTADQIKAMGLTESQVASMLAMNTMSAQLGGDDPANPKGPAGDDPANPKKSPDEGGIDYLTMAEYNNFVRSVKEAKASGNLDLVNSLIAKYGDRMTEQQTANFADLFARASGNGNGIGNGNALTMVEYNNFVRSVKDAKAKGDTTLVNNLVAKYGDRMTTQQTENFVNLFNMANK